MERLGYLSLKTKVQQHLIGFNSNDAGVREFTKMIVTIPSEQLVIV